MNREASRLFKVAYCIVLISTIIPFGIAGSSWVAIARGTVAGGVLNIGPVALILLGAYRIYLVARRPGTLDSRPTTGIVSAFRAIGICGIYLGVIFAVINLAASPLMRMFLTNPGDSNVAYFVAGLFMAALNSLGTFCLALFEFSRLLAFEQQDAQAREEQIVYAE